MSENLSSILSTVVKGIIENEEMVAISNNDNSEHDYKPRLSALPDASQDVFVVIEIPSIANDIPDSSRILNWSYFEMDMNVAEIPTKPKHCWTTKHVDPNEFLDGGDINSICPPRTAYIEMGTTDEEHLQREVLNGMWDLPKYTTRCLMNYLCDDLTNRVFGVKSQGTKIPARDALNQAFLRMKRTEISCKSIAKSHRVYLVGNLDDEYVLQQMICLARMWRHVPSYLVAPSANDFLHFVDNTAVFSKSLRECNCHLDIPIISAFAGAFGNMMKIEEKQRKPTLLIVMNMNQSIISIVTTGLFGLPIITNKKDIPGIFKQLKVILSDDSKAFEESGDFLKCMEYTLSTELNSDDKGKVGGVLLSTREKITSLLKETLGDSSAETSVFIFITGHSNDGRIMYSLLTEKKIESNEDKNDIKSTTTINLCGILCNVIYNNSLCHEGFIHMLKSVKTSNIITKNHTELENKTQAVADFVGKRVAKYFQREIYYGTVTKSETIKKRKYWLIDYDDGDREHVGKVELNKIINLYEKEGGEPKKKLK